MTRTARVCFALLTCCLAALGLAMDQLWARGSDLGAAACTELLQDGGFEAGGQGWLQYSVQGYELISDFNPRAGELGAYLAGVNEADDRISQQVSLPGGTITLRAWWYLATAETAGAFDHLTVSLLRPDGTWLAHLLTVNNTAPVGLWDELVIDLSSYAGQAVLLRFTGRTDENNISDFYLDDISIVACAADPSPTATATATKAPPTATATATTTKSSPTTTATPTATPLRGERRCYLPCILEIR